MMKFKAKRTGHTLVELIASLASAGIIVTGIAATLLISTRAVNEAGSTPINKSTSASVLADVMADVNLATQFTERTDTAITVIVPDRNGDASPDSIRYSWSGTPGTPLMYSFNGGPSTPLLDNVQQFNLSYLLRSMGPPAAPPPPSQVEGPEQILIFHDDAPGGSFKEYQLEKDKWPAQYFKPAMPANAVSWKITRVRFMAKQVNAATENMAVDIRTASASQIPTATVLASVSRTEASLPTSYVWTEVTYSDLAGLDPAAGLCLVLRQVSTSNNVAKVQYEESGSPMTSNTHWLTTSNYGSSWSTPESTRDMRFYVYGTITTLQ